MVSLCDIDNLQSHKKLLMPPKCKIITNNISAKCKILENGMKMNESMEFGKYYHS